MCFAVPKALCVWTILHIILVDHCYCIVYIGYYHKPCIIQLVLYWSIKIIQDVFLQWCGLLCCEYWLRVWGVHVCVCIWLFCASLCYCVHPRPLRDVYKWECVSHRLRQFTCISGTHLLGQVYIPPHPLDQDKLQIKLAVSSSHTVNGHQANQS